MAVEDAPLTPFTPEQYAWIRETFGPGISQPSVAGDDPMGGSTSQGTSTESARASSGEFVLYD